MSEKISVELNDLTTDIITFNEEEKPLRSADEEKEIKHFEMYSIKEYV